jgi:transketolase N-terminal domain/subunit
MSSLALTQSNGATVGCPDIQVKIAEAARFTRRHIIASIYRATSGHPGGALSCADLMATLFGAELNVWPSSVNDPQRDRFVLSKAMPARRFMPSALGTASAIKKNRSICASWAAFFRAIPM